MPTSDERRRAQTRERVRRHRERQKQQYPSIPPEYDSALTRAALGEAIREHLLPRPQTEGPRWAEDDGRIPAADPRAIPGRREYVQTPYGAQARIRAQQEAARRASEVVDCVNRQPEEPKESIRERVLRSLPNSVRRDAVKREQAVKRAEAEAAGELAHPVSPDWAWLTSVEGRTDGDWREELARRTDQQDRASEEPYRFTARFANAWDDDDPMCIDAPWKRR